MSAQAHSPVFQFQSHPIRTTIVDGQPWFVARDVCAALGIGWTGHSLKGVPTAWIGMVRHTTPRKGGNQTHSLRVISEPAVYKLAFRSNKPEADEFTNWVAAEVLPAIRKTGKYESESKALPQQKQKALPAHDPVQEEIDTLLKKVEFYTKEVNLAGEEIAKIMARESLKKAHTLSEKFGDPHHDFHIHTATSIRFLFSSINFSLNAVRDTVRIRREHSI